MSLVDVVLSPVQAEWVVVEEWVVVGVVVGTEGGAADRCGEWVDGSEDAGGGVVHAGSEVVEPGFGIGVLAVVLNAILGASAGDVGGGAYRAVRVVLVQPLGSAGGVGLVGD